ncbi:type I-E CRISPR-associated protein Cse2/CasB [Streptomyces syringium]|uniref:type I-E CRISPR-associated protein Cse2/CasB n=1 Tax=Streptomyces syringium TaxID=76729 RepID=UPI003D91CC6C
MTADSQPTLRRRPTLGLVGATVSEHINVLQRGYLADRADAVAALARMRRGVGKPYGTMPELWGLTGMEALYEVRTLSEERTIRAEEAAHTALTLWALHQQSHRQNRMHQADGPELGAAVRRLMPGTELDEPTRKRFVRAGTASSLPILAQRLRDIVLLLRRDGIPLDYGLLADQLEQWQQPGGLDRVRRSWGRSFHAYRPQAADGGATQADHTARSAKTAKTEKEIS